MRLTLEQYYELPTLPDNVRKKMHEKVISTIMDDTLSVKFESDIQEMIDYFITELGNADFIRLCDKIEEKNKRG